MEFYPLVDRHPWQKKWKDPKIMAVKTHEFRAPKQGEWYISGAIAEVYKAPKDIRAWYYIAQIVRVRKIVTYIEIDREVR